MRARPTPAGCLRTLLLLGAAVALLVLAFPKTRYRGIVIHHTASRQDTRQSLRRFHRRYILDAAYHLVLSNGRAEVPLGHLEATRWYLLGLPSLATGSPRCNLTTVQLSVVGNYQEDEPPDAVKGALGHAVGLLQERYSIPDDRVRVHRDCSSTLCPGRHVTAPAVLEWQELYAEQVPAAVREQQRGVVAGPYLLGSQLSAFWGGVAGLALLAAQLARRRKRPQQPVVPSATTSGDGTVDDGSESGAGSTARS